jgi:carboxypeptidase Taq
MNNNPTYDRYKSKLQKIADVKYAAALLQWDQETYLPPKGAAIRGQQIASLSEIAHEMFIDEKFGNLLNDLAGQGSLTEMERRNVELSLYDYNKSKKLPSAFVRELSEAVNKSFHAWIQARKENAFAVFQEPLGEIIRLKKQETEFLGYEAHPYNALMNDYDRGLTVAKVDKVFAKLKPELSQLIERITDMPQVDDSFLFGHFDKDKQWALGLEC